MYAIVAAEPIKSTCRQKMSNDPVISTKYSLSGGGTVTVHKPFGSEHYIAIVEQDGRYPEPGKTARNVGRSEFSTVLEGRFEYIIDGTARILEANQSTMVPDGSRYSIEGTGKVLVVVHDMPGGKTEIV